MLISIIIVNHNVKYFLEQCLISVHKACEGIEAEILVVDNASSDGSSEWLSGKFPSVKFYWLSENLGFGKGNNLALKDASGQFVLFLNPDTIIAEDTIRLCLDEMNNQKNTGALGVRMIDGSGRFLKESKRGLPTGAAAFYKFSGLASLFPRSKKIAAYYAGHLREDKNHDVDILSGAFMMLSRKAVENTNGFDEAFFMYGEDVDLSYRIKKAGMRCRYFSGTTIIHFKGESTQKNSPGYRRNFYGAMQVFVKKHFPEKRLLNMSTFILTALAKPAAALKANPTTNTDEGKPLRTAAVASQPVFDNCVQLLKHASMPLSIVGRIAPNKDAANKCLGLIDDVSQSIKQNRIEQLVFCNESLELKKIISLSESLGKKTQLMFWMQGASSIVGSNDKNRKGKFIAADLNGAASSNL